MQRGSVLLLLLSLLVLAAWVCYLHSFDAARENRTLREEKAALTAEKEALAAENQNLRIQNKEQAKRLEPPALQPPEIEIIRLLAKDGIPIPCYQFRSLTTLDQTSFDHHIDRLLLTFRFIQRRGFADTRPEVFELTTTGRDYAINRLS